MRAPTFSGAVTDMLSVANRLLADVSYLSGLPLGEFEGNEAWWTSEAPKLEKKLLRFIEVGEPLVGFPAFIQPLVSRFEKGRLPADLRLLRQLLLFCYKAEHIFHEDTEEKAIKTWCDTNARVRSWGEHFTAQPPALLERVKHHCSAVLGNCDWGSIIPGHGPGAVFDSSRQKGDWGKWFTTIDSCYPYGEYFYPSRGFNTVTELEVDDIIKARLIAVPKDARGPRLICVHPAESVWIQKGLQVKLEQQINRHRRHYSGQVWPKNHVLFDDQTVNGTTALRASVDLSYATLDLKEASDSLSDRLVQYLFGRHYKWFGSCRAHCVEIRSKRSRITQEIHSYAPMGNATTFPVQALVFWSICVSALEQAGAKSPGDVLVFGDDIIVPTQYAAICMVQLQEFGLCVNADKSFFRGSFRESCGVDAFKGVDVTPVRWRSTYDVRSMMGLQSLSSLAQRLRLAGYERAAQQAYRLLRSICWKELGVVLSHTNNPEHGGIAEYTEDYKLVIKSIRPHRVGSVDYQLRCTPVLRLLPVQQDLAHDWCHVMSSLTSLEKTGMSNAPSSVVSRHIRLNRGWAEVL